MILRSGGEVKPRRWKAYTDAVGMLEDGDASNIMSEQLEFDRHRNVDGNRIDVAHILIKYQCMQFCFVRLPYVGSQVMSIFVESVRAALICTKAVGKACYSRSFNPTWGTQDSCIVAGVAETRPIGYSLCCGQGERMFETCQDVVGEREGGAASGSERKNTDANRIKMPLPSVEAALSNTPSSRKQWH